MSTGVRRCLAAVLVAYGAVLFVVLVHPSPAGPSELVTRAMSVGTRLHVPDALLARTRVELGLNVLAFAPLSLLGSLLRPGVSFSAWVAAGFFLSFLVEMVQTLLVQRSATHSDVVANTLGMALGAAVAWVLLRVAEWRAQ